MNRNSEGSFAAQVDVIADLGTSLRPVIDADADGAQGELIESLESNKRAVMRELFADTRRLAELTSWSIPTLLDRIGCQLRAEEDLTLIGRERLESSAAFLRLLGEAADAVSTVPNRRAVTMTLAELTVQTGQDGDGLADLLELGDPSPWDYLRLGEIAQAARVARINARAVAPEDRYREGPFKAEQRVHISTPRLDAYLRGERDVLGEPVFTRIAAHIDGCDACHAAADYRRERLTLS